MAIGSVVFNLVGRGRSVGGWVGFFVWFSNFLFIISNLSRVFMVGGGWTGGLVGLGGERRVLPTGGFIVGFRWTFWWVGRGWGLFGLVVFSSFTFLSIGRRGGGNSN